MQLYRNARVGISLIVPDEWEIVSEETVDKLVKEAEKKSWDVSAPEYQRIMFYRSTLAPHVDTIFPDRENHQAERITIDDTPGMEPLFRMSPDEVRKLFNDQMKAVMGFESVFYDVKNMKIQDIPCLYVDHLVASDIRVVCCVFNLDGLCFSITRTCSTDRFAAGQDRFLQILQTMKFER